MTLNLKQLLLVFIYVFFSTLLVQKEYKKKLLAY